MSRHIPESFVLFRQRDITIASFGESTRRCWKPTCSTCSLCQCSFVLSLPHLLNSIEHTSCTCSIATVSASCLRTAQSTILNGDPKRSLNSAHRHRTYENLAICWRRTILCQYLCNRSVFVLFFFFVASTLSFPGRSHVGSCLSMKSRKETGSWWLALFISPDTQNARHKAM